MTIEINGHVDELRAGLPGKTVATIQLEAERGNSQRVEIHLTKAEAKNYLPGVGVTIRLWPNVSSEGTDRG